MFVENLETKKEDEGEERAVPVDAGDGELALALDLS